MSSTEFATADAQTPALAGFVAAVMVAPLFVMVGLAVLLNWGRS